MAGDKIVQARNGASEFAQSAFKQGFAVGVIPFHHTAYHSCRPTSELQELAPVLRELQAGGGTDVNAALTLAGSYLAGLTAGRRVLYLITDGMTENAQEALQTGSRLKAAGIEIMTLGTPDADHAFLKKLASQERLTAKVSNHQLEAGIASMAKLLPAPSSKSSK
jgi:Mg-chelatase subunit ChlD